MVINVNNDGGQVYHLKNLDCRDKPSFNDISVFSLIKHENKSTQHVRML